MFKIIIAVLIGAVVMIAVFSKVDSGASPSGDTPSQETTTTKNTLTITGEVNKTGTYLINNGATLNDLITAAGGVTSNADEKAYNLDYVLENNLSFYIAPIYDSADTCSQIPIKKVNINEASDVELLTLNGVSSKIATNIVEYRTSKGLFKRLEQLKDVSQIGSATFEKMKNYVTLK